MEKLIGRYLSVLYRKGIIYNNHALKEYNITAAEHPFLLCLYEHEGITQDFLASKLIIDKGAAARAVSSLEEKGYVCRRKDEADKRMNLVYVTDKGKAIKEELQYRVRKWSRFLTADLPEEKKAELLEMLDEMAEKAKRTDLQQVLEWEDEQWNK